MSGLNRFRLLMFLQELRVLLSDGKSEAEALDLISRHAGEGRLRSTLAAASEDLRSGRNLATALFQHGHPFPPGMARCLRSISAEEQDLPQTIGSLESNYRIRVLAPVGAASPRHVLFFSIVFLVIAFMILFYLVPVFADQYAEFGMALPALTLIVINLSGWVRDLWFLIPFVVAGIGYGVYVWWIKPASLWVKMHQVFSLMAGRLRSGSTGEQALAWAADGVDDDSLHQKLMAVLSRVKNGVTLSEAFRGGNGFPAIVGDILALGEKTGDIRAAADEVADYFGGRSRHERDRYGWFMEIGFFLALLIILILLVLSMYLPMFSMASALSG